jgi:hypothetical protein
MKVEEQFWKTSGKTLTKSDPTTSDAARADIANAPSPTLMLITADCLLQRLTRGNPARKLEW